MNELYAIVTGICIGLVIAAPVGPVNVICIHRAASHGFGAGLMSGLGSVLGDGIFAAIAAFGVTTATQLIEGHDAALHFVGGLLLLVFGARLLLSPQIPVPRRKVPHVAAHAGLFGTTFALTITNPATLFGTFAMFGGAGALVRSFEDFSQTWLIVLAVMAGSLLWWAALSAVVAACRHMITDNAMRMINIGSGAVLIGFGLFVLGRLADNLWFSGVSG